MKKLLLSGAALLAISAAPAQAAGLSLDLAGHFKGYGVFNDNDEGTGESLRSFNIRKETEIHFTGETTLDSGLTVGVHVEMEADADDDSNTIEESYAYFSGGWGRVNFGEEDGVAYLLQVSAPSADSNIDGLRQYISTYNSAGTDAGASLRLDYDHVSPVTTKANKITYMTPVFNGFQAGVSYIPTLSDDANGFTATSGDNQATEYDDGYEVAFRYEGAFEGVGLALGAGYGKYASETNAGTVSDDADTYNVGLDLDFAGFGLGVAYLDQETEASGTETESDTFVVGADYNMGAYKLGASYYTTETETGSTKSVDLDRYTAGVTYSYGPGMSFRGSVSFIDDDLTADVDATQVSLGTQIKF